MQQPQDTLDTLNCPIKDHADLETVGLLSPVNTAAPRFRDANEYRDLLLSGVLMLIMLDALMELMWTSSAYNTSPTKITLDQKYSALCSLGNTTISSQECWTWERHYGAQASVNQTTECPKICNQIMSFSQRIHLDSALRFLEFSLLCIFMLAVGLYRDGIRKNYISPNDCPRCTFFSWNAVASNTSLPEPQNEASNIGTIELAQVVAV